MAGARRTFIREGAFRLKPGPKLHTASHFQHIGFMAFEFKIPRLASREFVANPGEGQTGEINGAHFFRG